MTPDQSLKERKVCDVRQRLVLCEVDIEVAKSEISLRGQYISLGVSSSIAGFALIVAILEIEEKGLVGTSSHNWLLALAAVSSVVVPIFSLVASMTLQKTGKRRLAKALTERHLLEAEVRVQGDTHKPSEKSNKDPARYTINLECRRDDCDDHHSYSLR